MQSIYMDITPLPGPLGWVRPMLTVADQRFAAFCSSPMTVAATIFMSAARWAASKREASQRIHTGYYPKAQRSNLKHRTLRDGLRTAPRREPAPSLQAQARAAQMGFAS